MLFHNQTRCKRQFPHALNTGTWRWHRDTGMAPITAKAAVALHQLMAMVKQHKAIRNTLDGITQTLAGCFRLFTGTVQRLIATTKLLHCLVKCFCTLPHLFGQHYRVFKRRVRFRLMGHSGFHPHNQCVANFTQSFIIGFKRSNTLTQRRIRVRLRVTGNWNQAGQ